MQSVRGFAPGSSSPLPLPTSMKSFWQAWIICWRDVEQLGVVVRERDLATVDAAGGVAPLHERVADLEELLTEAGCHVDPGSAIGPEVDGGRGDAATATAGRVARPADLLQGSEVAGTRGRRTRCCRRRCVAVVVPRARTRPRACGSRGRDGHRSGCHCDQTSTPIFHATSHCALRFRIGDGSTTPQTATRRNVTDVMLGHVILRHVLSTPLQGKCYEIDSAAAVEIARNRLASPLFRSEKTRPHGRAYARTQLIHCRFKSGAGETRTHTATDLNRVPLPIGLRPLPGWRPRYAASSSPRSRNNFAT